MKAADILSRAASLVDGDRAEQHGPMRWNHRNIARLWSAYLQNLGVIGLVLDDTDVAHMMALLKIARTATGDDNLDDWVDGAAYLAVAGQLVSEDD